MPYSTHKVCHKVCKSLLKRINALLGALKRRTLKCCFEALQRSYCLRNVLQLKSDFFGAFKQC